MELSAERAYISSVHQSFGRRDHRQIEWDIFYGLLSIPGVREVEMKEEKRGLGAMNDAHIDKDEREREREENRVELIRTMPISGRRVW